MWKSWKSPFTVTGVDLTFRLAPRGTRVLARIGFAAREAGAPLELHGEGLKLISAAIDGVAVDPGLLTRTPTGLTVAPTARRSKATADWSRLVHLRRIKSLTRGVFTTTAAAALHFSALG